MTNERSAAGRLLACGVLALVGGLFAEAPRAQILGKGVGKATQNAAATPTRPEGKWQGTARETVDGAQLEYAIELDFTGADDALQLTVSGTAKVPAEGQTLTVTLRARYAGTFRDKKLAMRSEQVDVRVVETGEQVPVGQQRIEAALADGVLQGRVGSDDEGWATFTAKKPGSGKGTDDRPVAAANAPVGTWTGTVREPGPNGREVTYQANVVFRGGPDDLRADVSADVQYPTEDGGTTPVEYRATFRGRVRDGELQLKSDSVKIKLVALGRTEDAPPQELAGRIADGVFRGTVRAPGEPPARFEMRPAGGPQIPERDGRIDGQDREHERRQREIRGEQGRGGDEQIRDEGSGDTARGGETARTGGGATAYPTLVLQRREITDPGLGGVASHTIALPDGWQFAGGPVWTGNPDNVVTFAGELRTPDGAAMHFVADQAFRYSRAQSQQGVFDDTRGQTLPDGAIARYAPQRPGEVASEVIVPRLRPGATGIRVVQAERMPKLEEALRALLKPTLDLLEQLQAQTRANQMQGMRTDASQWLVVERARVRYTENGTEWEEEVQCSMLGFHGSLASDLIRSENGSWFVTNTRSARAEVNQLDPRLGAMWACADSIRETPRWAAAVAEIKLAIAQAKTRAMNTNLQEIIRRGEAAAKSRAELSDMQMSSWRSQQDSFDRVQKARVDALGERQDFRSGDGNTWTVTNHYDRAFKNADDSIILTNDPNYRPAADARVNAKTWEEMQRVDPFGR